MDIEKTLEHITVTLTRADSTGSTLNDAKKSIGSLILACGHLVEVIEEQQRQIEELRAKVYEDPSTYDQRRSRTK